MTKALFKLFILFITCSTAISCSEQDSPELPDNSGNTNQGIASIDQTQINANGGGFIIRVKADGTWQASSSETWCTLSRTSGNGNGSISGYMKANTGAERSVIITIIAGKEKADICNAIGAHHDEVEMTSLLAPIVQVCDAISGARPGARREIVEAYIKRLNDLEQLAMSYPGVTKTYAIQAGRELRVIVGADKIDDKQTESLSTEIAKKIQDEMTYPGQVKITVIRETRAVSFAK